MKMWRRLLPLTASLALGLAACDDGATDINALDEAALRADAALVAADGMFQDLAHMESPVVLAGIGLGPAGVGIEIEGSRKFSKTVTFFDADGEEQPAYHDEETAKIHVQSQLEREMSRNFWSAEINRERDMWVTGLLGQETQRVWNGSGSGDVFRSRHLDDGTERSYDMESTAVIKDVVRGVPRADFPYPLEGTITRTIHAVITIDGATEERDIVAVITFDGDNTATMTVDGESWEIDLDDKGVKQRIQRRNG